MEFLKSEKCSFDSMQYVEKMRLDIGCAISRIVASPLSDESKSIQVSRLREAMDFLTLNPDIRYLDS